MLHQQYASELGYAAAEVNFLGVAFTLCQLLCNICVDHNSQYGHKMVSSRIECQALIKFLDQSSQFKSNKVNL